MKLFCGNRLPKFFALCFAFILICPLSSGFFASSEKAGADDIGYSENFDWNKFRGQNISINVYNWGEYISVDEGEEGDFDTNAEFENLTGIKVNYTNFASNEEMYAKLKSGGSSYDIIIPSDYMIARMINESMLEKLNFGNIPNFANIMEQFKSSTFDPTNEFSVAYLWGITGIIYNTSLIDPEDDISSWDILWNEKYAKDILMFSNSRDAFAISLMRLGYDVNTTDENEINEAADQLKNQKLLVQAYVMDEIFDKMGGGEAALAPYYAGDAITMMSDNPSLAFCVPEEGTNVFIDAMCIPRGSKNKEAAEMYINFMCSPAAAKANCEFVGYSTPHKLAYELLDDETKESISYPSDEILSKAYAYTALPQTTTKLIDSLWTSIMSSETNSGGWKVPVMLVVAIIFIIFLNIRKWSKKHRKEL